MTRESCGCRSNDSAWLELCPAHALEFRERHERAQREKDRAELLGWYSPGPSEPELVTKTEMEN